MLILKILLCIAIGYSLTSAIGYLFGGWALTNTKHSLAVRIRQRLNDTEEINKKMRMASPQTINKHGGLIKYRMHLRNEMAKRRREQEQNISNSGE